MKYRLIDKTEAISVAYSQAGDVYNVGDLGCDSFSVICEVDVDTPSAKTFDSGGSQVETVTFLDQASTDPGDYLVIYDTAGLAWAAAADITGSDPEPTGAVWAAIPAGRKVMVDLSAATTAATVAAAFEAGLDALTDVSFTTDDSAADGTMIITITAYGVVDDIESYNEDDSGPGTMTSVVTDAGVASEVNVADNEITIPSHGLNAGLKGQLTSTGTLPAGLSLATDYFVLVVDEDTIQLSASLNGAAVDITNQGSDEAVNTFTATAIAGASIKLEQANDEDGPWVALGSATNVTVDADFILEKDRPTTRFIRTYTTLTAGNISANLHVIGKGDRE